MAKKKNKKAQRKKTAKKVAVRQMAPNRKDTPKTAAKKSSHHKTAAKKAAVLGAEKKKSLPLYAAVGCALLMIGAIYYFIPSDSNTSYAVATQTSPGISSASQVTYPVSLFDDGKARHFQYTNGDMTVKYFILKSSDGVIRAAFDACDVCWPAGKGYYQDGDHMVCRNCGRRFASVLVNVVQGGCNPAPLNRNIVNDQLVIQTSDIQQGGKLYFDFSRRA